LKGPITFKKGTAQPSSYRDFEVARMKDAPVIEVQIVPSERPEPAGIGEPPVLPNRAGHCERDLRRDRQANPASANSSGGVKSNLMSGDGIQ